MRALARTAQKNPDTSERPIASSLTTGFAKTAAPTPAPSVASPCAAASAPTPSASPAETSRRLSSCSPRAAIDTLGTATGVTPSCVWPGTQRGRRRHEIFAADQRPLGMDRAAFVLEEGAGHAHREVSRRELAVAAPLALLQPRRLDRRLGRREPCRAASRAAPPASPRRPAAAARPRCATPARAGGSTRRSPCGRRSPCPSLPPRRPHSPAPAGRARPRPREPPRWAR